MLFGIVIVLAGLLLGWLVSGLLGGLVVVAGVIKVAFHLVIVEPEVERPNYDRGATTYTLRSSKPRS